LSGFRLLRQHLGQPVHIRPRAAQHLLRVYGLDPGPPRCRLVAIVADRRARQEEAPHTKEHEEG
jgi:hypothetical protein